MIDNNRITNWIVKYKRQTAVACILLCLVVVAAITLSGRKKGEAAEAEAAANVVSPEAEEENAGGAVVSAAGSGEGMIVEQPNILEKDAHEDVNTIVGQYFDYMSAGDMEGMATVVDEISDDERNRILGSQGLVEGYQNISCYTKKGLEENSYVVFVYYELKFQQIETAAPGLSPLYVYTNEEGNLCIMKKEASQELTDYVEQIAEGEDVQALRKEVKQKYEEAKAADENLAKQEERYVRLSSEPEEEPAEVADAGEETPAEGEEAPEETAPEPEEETPEETPEEEPADSGEATAQNRETRFTESVRLRAEPSTEAEYLGTAYQGEHVTQIESYGDGWSKIKYNDKECYCKTEFLE
ncbi:MAG: SH3 domain-containing protein [Lachnospiraceae bacterium]|nr:SH3 domain-containing protein [Lachnospiraceae bacterium]